MNLISSVLLCFFVFMVHNQRLLSRLPTNPIEPVGQWVWGKLVNGFVYRARSSYGGGGEMTNILLHLSTCLQRIFFNLFEADFNYFIWGSIQVTGVGRSGGGTGSLMLTNIFQISFIAQVPTISSPLYPQVGTSPPQVRCWPRTRGSPLSWLLWLLPSVMTLVWRLPSLSSLQLTPPLPSLTRKHWLDCWVTVELFKMVS